MDRALNPSEDTVPHVHFAPPWWVLVAVNAVLGILLWLEQLTDYQLAGTLPGLLFPFLVGLTAWTSISRWSAGNRKHARLLRLSCFPSLLGSATSLLLVLLMLIPPFMFGALFAVAEMVGEKNIQEVVSPDGSRIATVIFRPVGAYSGGTGRIYIRVRHTWFPLVERDVYYQRVTSVATGTPMEFVVWQDSDTLWVPERNLAVPVGVVEPRVPGIVALLRGVAQLLQSLTSVPRR